MKKENNIIDVGFQNHNTAIIVVGGIGTDKTAINKKIKGEWTIMRDDNEKEMDITIRKSDPNKKPNLIIVDWVKDGIDFINATLWLNRLGYEPKNINMVYIKGDVESALKSNGTHSKAVIRESYDRAKRLLKNLQKGKLGLIGSEFDGSIWVVDGDENTQVKSSGNIIDMVGV